MRLFEKIKDWLYNLKEMYNQSSNDKKMKKVFSNTIKEMENDRTSFYTQNNLRSTNNFLQVVYVIDIPEEYQIKGQQWQIMDRLNENSYFISKYLREQLKLGDNVSMPEYYHIEDPSSGKPLSCRYLAIWSYTPVLLNKKPLYIVNSVIGCIVTGIIGAIAALLLI